ncbi:putative methyltransferase [Shewanella hanedai]|uniref:Class I SAM-dependent methyltransferase n=1 Tax=Shewanella hanedai TaxID=25 RepID=A0A553JT11_SHEHA|nr:class I SAM-dependent methyltransferase [Shewanella hanedai]TRY15595.1 class I SAM-dependent methyltransferase [Shewanella hanedai]GGI72212.1 putative methyltransferase [Shewanella hanedai]
MIVDLKAHYQKLYAKSGDSPASLQYACSESQRVRFSILSEGIDKEANIIDLGCGLADMLPFLREKGFRGKYLGCDFVPEFVQRAKEKYQFDDLAQFQEFNIIEDELPEGYDYVLISGIFNNKISNNLDFIHQTLTKSMHKVKVGIVFNAMSEYVQYQDDELFYVNPMVLFDFCKTKITPYVVLKHDYITKPSGFPYEFTMKLMHKAKL